MSGIIYSWSLQISRSTLLVEADGHPLPEGLSEVSAFYKEVSPRYCVKCHKLEEK